MTARILIVDDEEIILRSCARILSGDAYRVETTLDSQAALHKLEQGGFDLVVLDIKMPHIDGMQLLQHVKERHPEVDAIMMTGLSQIQTAVKAMKLGAFDYLPKPFDPMELKLAVDRALERRRLLGEAREQHPGAGLRYRFENMVGDSPQMQLVFGLIAKCAPTSCTVLITGESGTGKEMVARAIHYNSLRKDQPFVAVDCTTLSENLLESELFGHVKGAFTGAVSNKRGLFEVANHGTLFLDELGNIPLSTQAKLLRVIQEHEFKAVGDSRTQSTNVRLLAATNSDLRAMVSEGSFREDLYYRINVFPVHIPPLRDRHEDIPALTYQFLKSFSRDLGRTTVPSVSDGAMSLLVNHPWPGNVRQLQNTLQRALILSSDDTIRLAHLADILDAPQPGGLEVPRTSDELKRLKKIAREKSVEDLERQFVQETLRRNEWNVTRSAEETGMQRANFQALMKKYGIRVRDTGAEPEDPPQ